MEIERGFDLLQNHKKFVNQKANISNNNNNHFIEKERCYFSMELLNK